MWYARVITSQSEVLRLALGHFVGLAVHVLENLQQRVVVVVVIDVDFAVSACSSKSTNWRNHIKHEVAAAAPPPPPPQKGAAAHSSN